MFFYETMCSAHRILHHRCRADVLAYDRSRGAHHVLYEDGEDEWLKLPCEVVSWQKGTPARSLGAGLSFGALTLSTGDSGTICHSTVLRLWA